MLGVEYGLHRGIRKVGYQIDTPVGKFAKEISRRGVAGIKIGIAQTGQHLMLTIKRHPSTVLPERTDVAGIHFLPHVVDGLTANKSVETLGIGVVGILAILQHVNHIVQTLFDASLCGGVVTRCVCHGQGRHIVPADMPGEVKIISTPIYEVGVSGLPVSISSGMQASLTDEGSEQSVDIILHQHLDVEIHSCLEWTVEQGDLIQVEMMRIKQTLRMSRRPAPKRQDCGKKNKSELIHNDKMYS